ncbi:hypothetical protein PFAG_05798 [Plasmodium falciparum Santa Lucia]|uniref:Uncharacterized protein n=1 Tax=Plasmodium falciparum Santa Lucia TaxID=478859 RepID=W7FY89_PLAFA|nr:hypothetical protein PFAG_05798 [Plasmodium falciparum Santa Lucia]
MSDLGCLHKFVNIHAEIFVQSFYAVIESSQFSLFPFSFSLFPFSFFLFPFPFLFFLFIFSFF